MADTEQKSNPPPQYIPPSQVDPASLAKAFEEAGIVEAKPEAKAEAAKPPEQKTEAPVSDEPELLKRARDNAAKRKAAEEAELQTAKPYMDALRVLSPVEAQAVARAKQSGDPVAVLNALGFTHQQYTARVLGTKPEEKPADKAAPVSELAALKREIEELKRERDGEKMSQTRSQYLNGIQSTLKDDTKFRLVNDTGDYEAVERVLIQHFNEYGKLPSDDFAENIRLAAEVVEFELKKEEAKWKKRLTSSQTDAQAGDKKPPVTAQASAGSEHRTLTNNNTSAPGAPPAVSTSREDFIRAFIEKGEGAFS